MADQVMRPAADWELASMLADATANRMPVEMIGGSTKAALGRPRSPAAAISTHVLRGIRSYDPAERMITVQAGCLLTDLERELAINGQMLGFEPVDLAAIFNDEAGRATIGGVICSNFSGSRRIAAGGIADNLLGVRAVTGAGEIFQSGGAVSRSVGGIDLKRAMVGSWGTLAALVEVSLRVHLVPQDTTTVVVFGLSEEIAIEAMSDAMQLPHGITGAVHLEPTMASRLWTAPLREEGKSVTAVRLESQSEAAAIARLERLREVWRAYGDPLILEPEESIDFWSEMRHLTMLPYSGQPLWRISTRPSQAFSVVSSIRRYMDVDAVFDWGGGLIWLEVPEAADAGATEIRRVIASTGGHAILVRASDEVKQSIDVFEPMRSGVESVSKRLKNVFDPAGILNPGRMFADM